MSRDTELKKVPYMLIAGDKEMAGGLVALRKQGGGDKGSISVDEFAGQLLNEIEGASISEYVEPIVQDSLSEFVEPIVQEQENTGSEKNVTKDKDAIKK